MFFYGTTQHGKRLHMGVQVLAGRGRSDEVETYCGCTMYSVDLEGDAPPTHRVDEFCKSCFRTYAWNKMSASVEEQARLVGWFDATLKAAREQRWNANDFLLVLKEKADLIRALLGPEAPENVVSLEATR